MAEAAGGGQTTVLPAPRTGGRRLLIALIVFLVLMLIAAAAVAASVLTAARPIAVSGTVIDSLTGRPVAAAPVSAGGKSTSTDPAGAFRLPGLPKAAAIDVRAANYVPTTVQAASGPMTIRLTPVPVTAMVTSGLTGRPLAATIQMPDEIRVVAAGTGKATVYRVGPGDRVTLSAAGYSTSTGPVTGDRTITAVLQPTWHTVAAQLLAWAKAKQDTAIVDWLLRPATGYQYTPVPPPPAGSGQPDIWQTQRQVVGENANADLSVLPYGTMDERASFIGGGRRVTIAGQPAWHGSVAEGTVASAWYRSPLSVIVVGEDLAVTDKVLAGIVAAEPHN
jgi:Carboxypeptidase regulatory-like domain